MRFVFAIVAFVTAAVLIGFGIAQRTVFLEPDRVTMTATISGGAHYVVIEPDALSSHPGKQTVTVSGADTVFVAYGRSADVEGWLGTDPYIAVHGDTENDELVSEIVVAEPVADSRPEGTDTDATTDDALSTGDADAEADAEPEAAVSPAGSDLWLEELTGEGDVTTTLDVPDGISLIVASDGIEPVPSRLAISWPVENSTPWAGPLILGGALLFLIGTLLLILGFVHHRRARGPRRNLPKGPKAKLMRAPKPSSKQLNSGRRAIGRSKRVIAVPVALGAVLALSSCSAEYWPDGDDIVVAPPTETAPPTEAAADVEAVPPPAVTVPQMERIMAKLSEFTATADEELDTDALPERFEDPALSARMANYAIRESLADQPPSPAIPASPITVTLPQQAVAWPRVVLVVTETEGDETVAPTSLILQQNSPRENYKVVYQTGLAPDADFPELAPASVGAPIISPEYKGLVMPPGEVSAAYADVLQNGADSEFAADFDLEATTLDEAMDAATRKSTEEDKNPTLTLDVATAPGDGPTIALGTVDAGALVSVDVLRTEVTKPNDGGTVGFQEGGAAAAISGFSEKSAKGVQRETGIELLFYVPPIGSEETIRLLGWSESLLNASEVK